jgi:hypothetical protein
VSVVGCGDGQNASVEVSRSDGGSGVLGRLKGDLKAERFDLAL